MKSVSTNETANPVAGRCPRCGGFFVAVGRTGRAFGTPGACDLLEWRCADCGHEQREVRRLANGKKGEWPASKFTHK